MAYLNRLPQLSRIAQGTRNDDFIPIVELKDFDKLMGEIVERFRVTNNANSDEAANIASKLKDIEYNLADAFIYDEEGNIIGKNSYVNGEGVEVPKYGEYAMDTMLQTIDGYYNEFVKLMGNDPNVDYWKVDLDKYYKDAIDEFKNKINSVFINSANAAALEAKVSESNDYVSNDAVDLPAMSAMRLNPDIAAFTRNITISPVGINVPTVAFEVTELEKDSLVLNLKVQNGSMYYDLNVVLDNGKWDVKCVDSCNVNMTNNLSIDVYKYEYGGKTYYVFTLNTDQPNTGVRFNFEIEGLLIGGYRFNATGFNIEDHDRYFKYTLASTSERPIYTEIYYTKQEELDENGDIARITYIPHEHLNAWLPDTEYYTRAPQFTKIKKIDIADIAKNNKLVADPKLSIVTDNLSFAKPFNKLHVSYEVSEAIDDDADEDVTDRNNHVLDNPKIIPDRSVRMFEAGKNYIAVANKDVREIDNGIACGYGNTMFDVVSIRPGQTINTGSGINKILTPSLVKRFTESWLTDNGENSPITFNGVAEGNNKIGKYFTKYEFLDETYEKINGICQIIKIDESIDPTGEHSRMLNREIKNSLIFANSCYIRILKRTEKTYDILIIPDDDFEYDTDDLEIEKYIHYLECGSFYIMLTTNLPDNPNSENVLVYRGITNTEYNSLVRNPVIEARDWIGAASNDKLCILLRSDGLSYTYDGQLVYDMSDRKCINTGKPIQFNENTKIKYDNYGHFFFIWDTSEVPIPENQLSANASDLGTLFTHTNILYFSHNGFDWYMLDLRMFRARSHRIIYTEIDTSTILAPVVGTKYYKIVDEEYVLAGTGGDDLVAWEDGVTYYAITQGTYGKVSYAYDPTTWDADDTMFKRTDYVDTDPFIFKPYGPDRFMFIMPGYSKCVILTEEGLYDIAKWTKYLYSLDTLNELDPNVARDAEQLTFDQMFNKEHIYITPFHCADFTFTKHYYVFIDADEGKIAYGSGALVGSVNELITTFTKVAINGITLNSLTAYDFHFEGIPDSNIILWGEGLRDAVNKGWFRAPYNNPGSWTKNATITLPIKKVIGATEVYRNPSNNVDKLGSLYRILIENETSRTIYESNDDGVTISVLSNKPISSGGTDISHQILDFYIVGMNKDKRVINNDADGTIHFKEVPSLRNNSDGKPSHVLIFGVGNDVDGEPIKIATTHKAFASSICCREATTGYAICIFNDDKGYLYNIPMKLSSSIDKERIQINPVYAYKAPAIREIHDSDYGIYGNTDDYAVAVNKGYTDAYDPTSDPIGGSEINTSVVQSTYGPIGFYPNHDEPGKISLEVFNRDHTFLLDDLNFGANKMFISVNASNSTITESNEYFIFGSEVTKGAKLIKASDLIENESEFDAASMSYMIPGIDVYVQNAFECKYGLFLYGVDDNNRTKLYLLSNDNTNSDYGASVKEMLDVEAIDFIKDIDEDIVISTYDSQNPYDKYTFNKNTISFDKSVAIDVSDVYSFNNIIRHGKKVFFVNGTGSNPIIHAAASNNIGIFEITKSLNSSGVINTDINQFIKNASLFGTIVTNKHVEYVKTSVNTELLIITGRDQYGHYHAYMWLINFNGNTVDERLKKFSIETADSTIDKTAYDIATIIDHNSKFASDDNPFGFISQKSTYKLEVFKKDLTHKDKVTKNITDQFIIDDYIFDKSNNSISLKNYGISGDDRFIMSTEKIAVGKTIASGKTNIAIALGEENAIALYDSDLDTLKVIRLQYTHHGQVIRLDSNYHTVQSVIMGSSNTENTIYILVYGRFPTVIGTTLQYNDKVTYKLFSLTVPQAKEPNEYITITEEQFTYADTGSPRTDVKNYISSYENCKPSEDMELYTTDKSNLQFIDIIEGVRYEDTYSMVYWDKVKNCISFYTRYVSDSSLQEKDESEEGIVGPFADKTPYYYFATGISNTGQIIKFAPYGNNGRGTNMFNKDDMETYVDLPVICLTNRKTINLNKEKAENSGDLISREYEVTTGSRPYNLHIQTQLGVFRYMDRYIPGEDHYTDMNNLNMRETIRYGFETANAFSYRNRETGLWFTPENTNVSVLIKTPELGKVTDIFENSGGVFIQVRQISMYGGTEHVVYALYRLCGIPCNNVLDVIYIGDDRYFEKMSTSNAEIKYMADTRLGLFAAALEPKGLTTIKSGLNADVYTGISHLFFYNGVDFVDVSYQYSNPNQPSAVADWLNFYAIFDAGEHTYLLSTPNRRIYELTSSEDGTGFILTNVTSELVFNWITPGWGTTAALFIDTIVSDINFRYMFNRKTSYSYPAYMQDGKESFIMARPHEPSSSTVNNTYGIVFYDLVKKEAWDIQGSAQGNHDFDFVPYPGILRSPILKPNEEFRRNELLRELTNRDLPVDKNLRAYGFIVYNNLKINIDGIKIVSDNGNSNNTPAAIVFNIDKNFRFNKDVHDPDDMSMLFNDGRIYIDSKDTSVLHKANFDVIY